MTRLLLLSNSTQHGRKPLEHAADLFRSLFGSEVKRVTFVPFALQDLDAYTTTVRAAFEAMGFECRSVHEAVDPVAEVEQAQAIYTGGGNTFRLLDRVQRLGLVEPIRRRVADGLPYTGASAGSNLACPTIRTTNDMPIVEPPSFEALALIPFQINPHYLDPDPGSKHMGETREQRLREFHEENDIAVLGLREGTGLLVDAEGARLVGERPARLFRPGQEAVEFAAGAAVDELFG